MKDLKIEYRDGKLIELRVDGVLMEGVTAISFSHEAGKTQPELIMHLPVNQQESLTPPDVDRRTLRSVQKRFADEQRQELGGFPQANLVGGYQPERNEVSNPLSPPKKL
ncbi:TPA: hypothetical protein ACYVBH_004509 [Klebsiella pneumoniae]|uniref:hypothetical protein n=1 Tax=Klebsiella pneumoniae TaxID=573 RepID=UPI0015F35D63|nr:hypothetical protein [Klebsiella pneumoniae]MBA8001771.1 hypothetical protein [Klebsiella pneumoniae]